MSEFKIKDGVGTGNLAEVDSENLLHVFAVTETEPERINSKMSDAYVMYMDITPSGANKTFCYIKNTDQTKIMVVNWYRIWTASSAEAIDIYLNETGTASGDATLVPVNSNITSSKSATGTFLEGTDITGLSGGTLYDRLRISGDGKDVVDNIPGKLIVPTGGVVAFQALNGSIPIELTVSFHYREAA